MSSSPASDAKESTTSAVLSAAIAALPAHKVPSYWASMNMFQKAVAFETVVAFVLCFFQLWMRKGSRKSHNTSVVLGIFASLVASGSYANSRLFGVSGKIDAIASELATISAAYKYLKQDVPASIMATSTTSATSSSAPATKKRAAGDPLDSLVPGDPETLIVLAAMERKSTIVLMVCRFICSVVQLTSVITLGLSGGWKKSESDFQ